MKNTILKLTAIAALVLSVNVSANDTRTFWYVMGEVKANVNVKNNTETGSNEPAASTFDCYDPANVGIYGTDGVCNGKLVVDRTLLLAMIDGGQDYSHNAVWTGQVSAFNSLFFNKPVNYDITGWDVSGADNFSLMFWGSSAFNQDISGWNMSNATNTSAMFMNATSFNQNISGWNMSNVVNPSSMFYNAKAFNQPLNNWNTSNFQNIEGMFSGANNFNQPLNNWNVSNVWKMRSVFYSASSFNQDISGWNTSNTTDMYGMFWFASSFNQNLSTWNVNNVFIYNYFNTNANTAWRSDATKQPNFN